MKQVSFLLLASIFFFSCGTKKPIPVVTPTTSNVTIKMQHSVGETPVEENKIQYVNAAGNTYSFSTLKYYLSNGVLVKDDGTEYKLNNYTLINALDATKQKISVPSLPAGKYTSLRLLLGVDNVRNHTGAQDGDLDPSNGMIWTWSTGYIFLKHEGSMIDNTGNTVGFSYHYALDKSAAEVTIPITLNAVAGGTNTITLNFDVNALYDTPTYDFNTNRYVHSDATKPGDVQWMNDVKSNVQSCFSLVSVQ